MIDGIRELRTSPKSRMGGVIAAFLYTAVYLISIGHFRLVLSQGVFGVSLAPNWEALLVKTNAPFLWEPVARISTPIAELLLAPLNVALGIILGLFVAVNVSAAIYLRSLPKQCRLESGSKGLMAILPTFLTGFACCAPTFLIPLVSVVGSLAVYINWLRILLIPLSVVLLAWGGYVGLRQVERSIRLQRSSE